MPRATALSAVRMAKTCLYIFRLFRLAASAACKKARLFSSMSRKARRVFRQRTFDQSRHNRNRVLIVRKRLGHPFLIARLSLFTVYQFCRYMIQRKERAGLGSTPPTTRKSLGHFVLQ